VDEVELHESHVDGVVGPAYPSQLLEAGAHAGGDEPPVPPVPPVVPVPPVPPVPVLDEPEVVPPAHVIVGTQTLTWLPLYEVSMLHVDPDGQAPSPSPAEHDETQKVSP
jgi:hypothetical protein